MKTIEHYRENILPIELELLRIFKGFNFIEKYDRIWKKEYNYKNNLSDKENEENEVLFENEKEKKEEELIKMMIKEIITLYSKGWFFNNKDIEDALYFTAKINEDSPDYDSGDWFVNSTYSIIKSITPKCNLFWDIWKKRIDYNNISNIKDEIYPSDLSLLLFFKENKMEKDLILKYPTLMN
jgi:hypothetical protein